METAWILEYGGTQVPRLGSLGTISVHSWHTALTEFILNHLDLPAKFWILITK